MTIKTIMDTLPKGNDPASAAVRSVFGRGFYDSTPQVTAHPNLMMQFLRLVEECGEFEADYTANELADVFIVMAQIAWKTGYDPAHLWNLPHEAPPEKNLSIYCGDIARHLRKYKFDRVHGALREMAGWIHLTADHMQIDFESVILAKLKADEGRGYQHSGEPAIDLQVNGDKPQPDYTLKIFQQGDRQAEPDTLEAAGYCYRDFS